MISSMDSTTPISSKPTPLDWTFRALGFVTLALIAFAVPLFPALELDSSWRTAIGRFFIDGRQFGTEIVFTYGPLGWAMAKTYWGDHWGLLVGWYAVQSVVFTAFVFHYGYRVTGYARVFFFAFYILFGLTYQDAAHQIFIAFAGLELIRRTGKPWRWSSAALLSLLVILSLVKFTNLLLGFFLVLLAAGLELWKTRKASALILPGVFTALFLAGWVACGQNPLNLPAYFKTSMEVSQGYQDAMGLACPSLQLYFGLSVAGLVLAYLAVNFLTSIDRIRTAALTLGALALLYLNWKHGYIRADGHQIGFYYAALMLITGTPVLLEDTIRLRWLKRTLLVGATLLALIGLDVVLPGLVRGATGAPQGVINANVAFLTGKSFTPSMYASHWQMVSAKAKLTKVQATVGRSSIDVLGFEQNVALFNDFNYQPRPVFQGYLAYTPYLANLNFAYFASDRAPEFVLFKLQTLDGRLAAMDDPQVLRLLVQRYRYLFSEQGYTLWQRKPGPFDPATIAPKPIRTVAAKFGESIPIADLASQNVWVEIDYRFSLLGKLRRFLFRPPLVTLNITDTKGSESIHRLPQPIGRSGFMLNPVIDELHSYMLAAGGKPTRHAASIRLATSASERDCIADDIVVRLYSLPPSDAASAYLQQADRSLFHMFVAVPVSYESLNPPNPDIISERPVMIMHAPSNMIFDVPAGARSVQGDFGFVAGAYTNGGRTNGAQFTIYWTDGGERRVLYERYLDPVSRLNDRGLQHFTANIPVGAGQVVMQIDPGPHGEYAYDWTGWTDIEFK